MHPYIEINGRRIGPGDPVGPGAPVYVVAELSANHAGRFERAAELVRAVAAAGADAVKVQTYTADTLTIDCDAEWFRVGGSGAWAGRNLHELYAEASLPWEWQPKLKRLADDLGVAFFSTPFDLSAVAFLESMGVPAYKIASFELIDPPLLRAVARTGKPILLSTGMATLDEVSEALETVRGAGANQVAVLKCTSAYPAPPDELNLRAIPFLAERFGVVVGLSDHTLGEAAAVAAVALGARIIEKHLTLARADGGPDAAFSAEPDEFTRLVESVRIAERALGSHSFAPTRSEHEMRKLRRSLFVVEDIKAGERFTSENVRSIRPGHGLPPKDLDRVLGKRAAVDIARGTPLCWDLIAS